MGNDSTDRIVAALRRWLATAAPGEQLPTSRALAAEFGASPVTVQKAMTKLGALGLVEARPGAGTFARKVRAPGPIDFGWQTAALGSPQLLALPFSSTQRMSSPDAISLNSGYPAAELLPERAVRAALARAARSHHATTRSPAAGLPELQAWFANELASAAPAGVSTASARDVLIVPGSQSGLSSVFRALVGAGQPLLIESPTYWGAILAAKQAGVVLVPLASGPTGPDPEEVARAFERTGARAFYAQPTFANPNGALWSAETRVAVLETVRYSGAFLIEDDWAHDLAIDSVARPIAASDHDGHIVYLRTLTKSVSPALRIAAVIARGPARERLLADRAAESMYVSGILQAAALDVVTQPAWRSHLRGFRQQLRDRRNLLISSLREHAPETYVEAVPAGGLNLWVRLPDGTDVADVVRNCELRGLIIAPGTEWFPAEPSGTFVRLNFSNENPDRFPAAAQILGDVLSAGGAG